MNKRAFSFSATLFVVSLLLYLSIVIIFYLVIGFDRASIEHRITETTAKIDRGLFMLSYLRTPLDDGTVLDAIIDGKTVPVRQKTESILYTLFDKKVCWKLESRSATVQNDCVNPVFVSLLDESITVPLHYGNELASPIHLTVTGYEGDAVE